MDNTKIFEELVAKSTSILITTHVSPDPDAIASVLLLSTALKLNFQDKQIAVTCEDSIQGFDYLEGAEQLMVKPLSTVIESVKPDLIIIVDAMNFARCTRQNEDSIKSYLEQTSAKLIIIDHHEREQVQEANLYINNGSPAVAMDVYELLFDQLGLNKPPKAPETAMIGIYSDSGGFIYPSIRQQAMFDLVSKLVKEGINLEQIANRLNQFDENQMRVLGELAANIAHQDDYTYSFLSDEFETSWTTRGLSSASLHRACGYFVNNFIRNVGERQWGFIIYKDALEGPGMYSLSLRSINSVKDVSAIAKVFDGGGHKAASGARLSASSISEAIDKIKEAIR